VILLGKRTETVLGHGEVPVELLKRCDVLYSEEVSIRMLLDFCYGIRKFDFFVQRVPFWPIKVEISGPTPCNGPSNDFDNDQV
jgi:hypothetical protein